MTSAEQPEVLIDTSVAVALCLEGHVYHSTAAAATSGRVLGLAGHAAFESYSVLTRLPPPQRQPPTAVRRLLDTNFPARCLLPADAQRALWESLADRRIAGGAVYDALVAAAARHHRLPLMTLDERAMPTYRSFGVDVHLLTSPA